ncbi:hypothetical protein J6590_081601 [Homalodisca vitripennis]|nr:hypothetical protein J6590_081601 [Homalodisca vitripennis]
MPNGSSTENFSDEEGPIRADGRSSATSLRGGSSCELHNSLKSYLFKPSDLLELGADSTMSLNRPNPIPKHTSDRNSCHTPPKTGAVERKCVRCKKYFLDNDNGEYLSS